jgi:hypothetical protein
MRSSCLQGLVRVGNNRLEIGYLPTCESNIGPTAVPMTVVIIQLLKKSIRTGVEMFMDSKKLYTRVLYILLETHGYHSAEPRSPRLTAVSGST